MDKTVIKDEFLRQAELIARGTEVLPGGIAELALRLQNAQENQKPLRVKLGMDPTRPDLHLGHSVVMRKLKQFQDLGHKIVLIIGGATAMVGDPSGKSETRKSLTKEEVEINAKTYLEQVSKIINIEKAEILNNADWLHSLKFTQLLELGSKVTVAKIMTRDDFNKRYQEGKPISIHELFYPLMQAYDSVEIDSDIELGGTDQRFNVLLGRDVQSAYGKTNPQMVMLLPLLEGTDGVVKMSKSYPEHCISLTDCPKDMYGKLMSIPDELILKYFTLLTDVPNEDLKQIENDLKNPDFNPMLHKKALASLVTELYNGKVGAKIAEEGFKNTVQNKDFPEDAPEFTITDQISILDLLVELKFAPSKSEAKRLVTQGAVKLDGQRISDVLFIVNKSYRLQSGKRNFAKLIKDE